MQAIITFGECEHNGDLDTYIADLIKSGAKIISSSVDSDEDEGKVTVEIVDDKKDEFLAVFKRTESFEFSDLAQI